MAGQASDDLNQGKDLWENNDIVSIQATFEDNQPGRLNDLASVFLEHGITMTSVQSKPPKVI